MKKCFIIWTSALFLIITASHGIESNLLVNAGFEEELSPAWEKRTPDDTLRQLYISEGSGHIGSAVVLENIEPAYTRLRQGHDHSIFIEPGSLIELSAWIKSEQGSDGVAMLQFYCIDSAGGILSQPTSVAKYGPFDWTRSSLLAVVPDGTVYVMAYLQTRDGVGRVWFDDVELTVKRGPMIRPPAPRIALLSDLPDDHPVIQRASILFEEGLIRAEADPASALNGAEGALAIYTGGVSSVAWSALESYASGGGRVFMDIQAFASTHETEAHSVIVGASEGQALTARMAAGLRIVQESDVAAGFHVDQIMPRASWPDGRLLVLTNGFSLPDLEVLAVAPSGEAGLVRLPVGSGSITACDLLSLREPYWSNVDAYYAFTPVSGALGNPASLGEYYPQRLTYEGVVDEMEHLASTYSEISLEDEGPGSGGYELWSLNLGTQGKPLYFLYAAAHGCEWETGYGLITFAQRLAEGKLQEVIDLTKVRIKIIPLLNPDGYQRMRRQNANGVDLNRQGDFQWEEFLGSDSNGDGVYGPNDYDWKGTAPLSEPEAQAYRRIIERSDLHCFLDFHGNTSTLGNKMGFLPVTGHPDNAMLSLDLQWIANTRLRGRHLLRQNDEDTVSQYLLDRIEQGSGTPFLMNSGNPNKFGLLIELPAQYSNSYGTLLQTDVTCELCRALFIAYPPPAQTDTDLLGCSVLDLRNAVRREASLIHHYTFEGPQEDSTSLRQIDRAGRTNLVTQTRAAAAPTYVQGADELSMAGKAVYGTNENAGAAWISTSKITLPPTLTIECLFRPDQVPTTDTYVLSTKDGDNRGYFIQQSPATNLTTRIGWGAYRPIVSNYITGHWYYVVSTYAVNAGKTTINSYYADITFGDELQQSITNAVENGHYGNSAILGIGCLYPAIPQYFAPCTIDEAAIYSSVLSTETLGYHLSELQQAPPIVAYREIFPNDANTSARHFPHEGWKTHRGTNAVHSASPVIEEYNTAFNEDLPAVASFPQDTGVTQGYLNNHAGPTDTNYLYWTEEMTNQLDVSWLKLITFDSRSISDSTLRVALRVDTNATPSVTSDDGWFAGADFDNAPGTSVLAIPTTSSLWHRHGVDMGGSEWAALSFIPDSRLIIKDSKTAFPTNGLVTAFGLFQDAHTLTKNMRLDNFTIYAQRISSSSPPKGVLIMVQ